MLLLKSIDISKSKVSIMRKILFSIVTSASILLAGGANNKTAVELPIGQVVADRIDHKNAGGIDWYKFELKQRSEVRIYVTPRAPFDSRIYITDRPAGADGLENYKHSLSSGWKGDPVVFNVKLNEGTNYIAIKTNQDHEGPIHLEVVPAYFKGASTTVQASTPNNTVAAECPKCDPTTVIVNQDSGERVKKLEKDLELQTNISNALYDFLQKLYFMIGANTDTTPDKAQKDAVKKLQALIDENKELKDTKGSFKDYKKKTVGE